MGHSQGTTQFFAANALYDDIKDKIEGYVAIAPVMIIENQYSPFVVIQKSTHMANLLEWLGFRNFMVIPGYISPAIRLLVTVFRRSIWRVLQLSFGVQTHVYVDLKMMPTLANHEPGGTSMKNMVKWTQGKFGMFDYGSAEENQEHYG